MVEHDVVTESAIGEKARLRVDGKRDLNRTWTSRLRWRSQLPAVALFLAGAGITGSFFGLERVKNRERQHADFERRATLVTGELRATLELPIEALQSVAALFDASETVSRTEFKSFVGGTLVRHPGIRALEWIPIVPAAERASYVARARAEGLVDFEFKEEGPDLRLVTARERAEHLPIYYMEPPDSTALGFDVGALPFRRAPADRAAESGRAVASERIRLVEDPPDVYAIAVFYPVRPRGSDKQSAKARGFAAEVFRVKPLVGPVLEKVVQQGVGVVLLDPAAAPERRLLYESTPGTLAASSSSSRTSVNRTFALADRTWSVTYLAGPVQQARLDEWPWGLLSSGLVISALLGLMLSTTTLIYRLRREVHAALRLGQYTLVEKIGQGGMGIVYLARHSMLRRATAVKLLAPGHRAAHDIARFEREVQLTSRLTHPNTIAIYDYGRTHDGIFYYAMEYIEGIALEDLVKHDGPLPAARVLRILVQCCGALEEAHARGMVHRDVKPANLMVMERGGIFDFVKVLDFGLARENAPDSGLSVSRANPLLGTPLYMSPEAILSGIVDARTDIYAVGCVAYYLLTGQTVFKGDSLVAVCAQHVSSTPAAPSLASPSPVPASLDALVLACLEKQPEQRPASAAEVARRLREIEGEIGEFGQEAAKRWWQERGRPLLEKLRADRSVPLRPKEDGPVTMAVAPRGESS